MSASIIISENIYFRLCGIAFIVLFSLPLSGQDCFNPPSGYTFYTTTNPVYNPPALTGFNSFSVTENAVWSINSTTGTVSANLIDDEGRSSTLSLTGQGTLVVDAEITDFSVEPNIITNCTQSFNVQPFTSLVIDNPSLSQKCPIDIVVLLDESGSILDGGITQAIRDGVLALAQLLNGTGSRMAVVEFNSFASRVSINGNNELQEINQTFLEGLLDYLNNDYNPVESPVRLIGGTNWEDALLMANQVNDSEFILMITDGNPTFYSFNGAMMGAIAGEGDMFDLTALKEAQDVANAIKASGKHIFVIGVDIPVNIRPIVDISGPESYEFGEGFESFLSSDYISVSSEEIVTIFTEIGTITCGEIIPTLGQWGIIILTLLLLIIGVVFIKNQSIEKVSLSK